MGPASSPRRLACARRWRQALTLFLVSLAAMCAAGCKNTNFLSTRDEVKLGRDASKEVESKYRVDANSPDADRVDRIGQRLMAHVDARPGVPYTFRVLQAKDVNAVSLPGGPVYVFRGLLDMVGSDDDALACVIAHEVGHVNGRHAAKQVSQQMAANVGIAVLLRGQGAQNLAGIAEDLLGLHYSREDEYEADKRGLSYAYKAGYDPRGMVRFFRKLQALDQRGGGPELLRTHPLTSSRITRAEKSIEARDYPYGR